jgi:hypothetical protein
MNFLKKGKYSICFSKSGIAIFSILMLTICPLLAGFNNIAYGLTVGTRNKLKAELPLPIPFTKYTPFSKHTAASPSFDMSPRSAPSASSSAITCQKLSVDTITKSKGGNSPMYAIDNNYGTFWSNNQLGSWIKIDLGASTNICSLDIAWYKGNLRMYNFNIFVSKDGAVFTNVFSGKSSGTTNSLERYNLPLNTMGRYVKITVNGNNKNSQAGITEIVANVANPPMVCRWCGNYDDFEGPTYSLGYGQVSPNGKWKETYAESAAVQQDPQTGDNAMYLTTGKATSLDQTYSSLVLSTAKYKDFDLFIDVKTVKQLRTPTPWYWENAWVMWNRPTTYDDYHYYAYTLFSDGVGQLEKKDNNIQDDSAEIFLAYSDHPSIKYNTWQNWEIMVTGTATGTPRIQIWIDGVKALDYTDDDPSMPRNSATMLSGGSIVLYCEDSVVAFDNVSINPL